MSNWKDPGSWITRVAPSRKANLDRTTSIAVVAVDALHNPWPQGDPLWDAESGLA